MYNVSFGSNYRFDIGKEYPSSLMNSLYKYERKGATLYSEIPSVKEISKTNVHERVLVSAPDEYDGEIETILSNKGIKFQKQSFKDALNPDNIVNRIELSKYDAMNDCYLVDVDTSSLDKLFKADGMAYIEPKGTNGIGNRYEQVGEFLKTGKNIHATRVYLTDEYGELSARVQDGRHRFAYMRDMGIKRIPIALDEESFNLAVKYGLTK